MRRDEKTEYLTDHAPDELVFRGKMQYPLSAYFVKPDILREKTFNLSGGPGNRPWTHRLTAFQWLYRMPARLVNARSYSQETFSLPSTWYKNVCMDYNL